MPVDCIATTDYSARGAYLLYLIKKKRDIYFFRVTLDCWIGCTGAGPRGQDVVSVWKSVGQGAPVQFQKSDIYFLKVKLDRWMGCTGAGQRGPIEICV